MKPEIYEAIFEKLPCAIMIADDDGRYVSINKAAEKLLGLPREQIIGKCVKDFVAPMREKRTAKMWNDFKADGAQAGTFMISRPNGTDQEIRYSAVANFMPGLHLSVAIDSN